MVFMILPAARAQTGCYDFGSIPTPAQWESSGTPLGCGGAPTWPTWHLFTPAHRRPAPHTGFNPGDARARPRVLVVWRCTGLTFHPVTIRQVRFLGYVVDQPEFPCGPGS